ncbi:tetratricopeptide repeat protein [Rufibacter roseus]|uniref:Tetratricopeptide repeat protein n=1 Tax=Rufibacter roseus TaxID=1567108 RepID=A0ABW2DK98_9BACT|nr:hypothetical protein [Rufibacter roseus]
MKAPLISVLALFLLMGSRFAVAQSNVLFDQKKKETITLSSFENADFRAMAEEIGRYNTNRSGKILMPVEFEQHLKIVKDGSQIKVEANVQKFWVPEKIMFRQFDVADAFTPTTVSAKIQLLGAGDKVVQTFDVSNKNISQNGNTVLAQTSFTDTSSFTGYKLKVVDQKLGFSHANRTAVRERVALVKRYYETEDRLALLHRDLQNINPNDVDNLQLHTDRLAVLERALDQLVDNRMERELNLKENDPARLRYKVKELDNRLRERRVAIDQTWARLPEIFYSRGLELAVNGNPRAARDFFARSLQANPAFAPSHLQLARLDLREGYVAEAAQRTKDILTRMQVDPETHRFAQQLALDVQNEYVRQGEQLNNQGKYEQALQQFEQARDYCRSISSLRCRSELWESGIAEAKGGIYNNMLADARLALRQNRLSEASNLAAEAQRYANNNRSAITSDAAAQNLMREVQQQVYQSNMSDGRRALQARQYSASLAAFEKAKSVALDYGLTQQADADNLIRQAAKPVLLERIADGQQYASLNQLAQARTTAAQINSLLVKYSLVNDRDLDVKYRALSTAIFSQECANAQSTYDQHYQRSLQYSSEGNYAQAAAELDKAIASAKGNAGCSISFATADLELNRIDAPAHYQELLQEVATLMNQSKFADAIKVYQEAGRHFEARDVHGFGLRHASLQEYALQSSNKSFVVEVARHKASNGDATEAIALIRRLSDLKLAKYNLNQLQKFVGETLAIRDVRTNPEGNYKQLAASYTGGDKALKKLGKAYEKKFKKLT